MREILIAAVHKRWPEAAVWEAAARGAGILCAGDLGPDAYDAPWPVPLWTVAGDDDWPRYLQGRRAAGHLMTARLIPDWRVFELGGLRVLGVGALMDPARAPGPARTPPCPGPVPAADVLLSHAAGFHRIVPGPNGPYDVWDA